MIILRKFIFTTFIIFLLGSTAVAAVSWVNIHSAEPIPATLSLVNDDIYATVLDFQLKGYYENTVLVQGKQSIQITAEDMTPLLEAGAPDLPKYYRSIIIPDNAHMQLSIEVLDYEDVELKNMVPSKGSFSRNIDPASVPFEFGEAYQKNAFYPEQIASLSMPYVMHDFRGVVVQIHPFRYNPVTGILRVYTRLHLSVESNGPAFQAFKTKHTVSLQRGFLPVYRSHFINYGSNSTLYDMPVENGKLFILAADNYYDAVLPLVDWKQTRGLSTEIVRISEIGNNSTNILNAVQSRYDSPEGLTFFLIVGDADDVVPATASGAASDPSYALLDGGNGDQYPDIFVGRLSANTVSQVETQVAKIIDYEANPDPDGTWYEKATGIASNQGAGQGDDGEADNVHMDNIRTDLLGYGYVSVDQIYDPAANVSTVSSSINDGRGLVNYVGHGSTTSWSTSGFSNSNVSSLSNTGKLPVILSVACVNGNFQSSTCFAEAWLRAGSANDQRGAVAFYGSSINQEWAPPMCAQDEFNDLLVADTYMTIGALMFSGSAQMIDEYGSIGFDMYATWHIFGDPSMPMRTKTPEYISGISVPEVLVLGEAQLSVSSDAIHNGVISLSKQGELLATAPVSSFGTTLLHFNPLTEIDTCLLTITGKNRIPWQQELLIIAPEGPYLVTQGYIIDDAMTGNGNGIIDFGETVNLNLLIHNVGANVCTPVNAQLSLDDPYVSLINDLANTTQILADSIQILGPYELLVSENVPDGHQISLNVFMDNDADVWESELILSLHAPDISFEKIDVLDGGNGRLDIGESAALELYFLNSGGSGLTNPRISLNTSDPYVMMLGAPVLISGIESGFTDSCSFNIDLQYATPPGHEIEFTWTVEGDLNYTATGNIVLSAGLVVEDFESGTFNTFDWISGGYQDWIIDSSTRFEGQYSARSGTLYNNQSSELNLVIEARDNAVLSFQYKVSSQPGADGLQFLIDGTLMDNWQGEIPWNEASYPLVVGAHELTWKYTKNSSGSSGSDCAWIDFIVLPLSDVPGSIIGDVTADAQINVQDIVRLVNIILGQGAPAQAYELFCGDLNGIDGIDIADLVLLVNIIMGGQLGQN